MVERNTHSHTTTTTTYLVLLLLLPCCGSCRHSAQVSNQLGCITCISAPRWRTAHSRAPCGTCPRNSFKTLSKAKKANFLLCSAALFSPFCSTLIWYVRDPSTSRDGAQRMIKKNFKQVSSGSCTFNKQIKLQQLSSGTGLFCLNCDEAKTLTHICLAACRRMSQALSSGAHPLTTNFWPTTRCPTGSSYPLRKNLSPQKTHPIQHDVAPETPHWGSLEKWPYLCKM